MTNISKFSATSITSPLSSLLTASFRREEVGVSELGNPVIKGARILREGTFTDMYGHEFTWTAIHLDQACLHYAFLKESNILPNVPVRVDHSDSAADVMGWISNVYLDPEDRTFLAADLEITEPEHFEKWERGTYRSRSVEIGGYEANDGAIYYPVIRGLAFVDVPAIEGLNSKKRDDGVSYFHFVDNKEKKVIDINHPDWIAAATYAQAVQDWTKAANYAQALVDWGRSAHYAQWVKDAQFAQACLDAGFSNAINGSFGAPAAPGATGSTHNYRLEGGRTTSDVVEVQGTLDRLLTENASLKQFKAESITSFRTDYIKGLVKAGKLAAPQEDQLIGLVNGLTEEQFTAFRVSYDAAPSASLFASYGSPVEDDDVDKISEKDECEQILASHKASGMNEESIKNTSSYKKLSKLDPAAAEKFVS